MRLGSPVNKIVDKGSQGVGILTGSTRAMNKSYVVVKEMEVF